MQQQQQQQYQGDPFGLFSTAPPPSQSPWSLPQVHHQDPFGLFPSAASYAGLFTRRPSQFPHFSDSPFGLQAELNKMTAQEIMDAKALAASKSHSEAERRRRERINNHLAKLRSLLPSTTKTDKASLLAEVIQHVKELRRQTSIIAETSVVPTETDELTVDAAEDGQNGRLIMKASLCCEDRNDLLPELIKALKSLRLRTLKAEITALGGRVKNVLFITVDEEAEEEEEVELPSISSVEEALKAVMDKSAGDESASANPKRQRTANINGS